MYISKSHRNTRQKTHLKMHVALQHIILLVTFFVHPQQIHVFYHQHIAQHVDSFNAQIGSVFRLSFLLCTFHWSSLASAISSTSGSANSIIRIVQARITNAQQAAYRCIQHETDTRITNPTKQHTEYKELNIKQSKSKTAHREKSTRHTKTHAKTTNEPYFEENRPTDRRTNKNRQNPSRINAILVSYTQQI